MSLAIANARDQYVLLRNFTTGKWENIAGDGKTCRIQVMKKADGDHLLMHLSMSCLTYPKSG